MDMPRFPELTSKSVWIASAGLCLTVCAFLAATAGTASAQGRLDAKYEASLAGLPIGKGAWIVDIADDQYSAAVSGAPVATSHSLIILS